MKFLHSVLSGLLLTSSSSASSSSSLKSSTKFQFQKLQTNDNGRRVMQEIKDKHPDDVHNAIMEILSSNGSDGDSSAARAGAGKGGPGGADKAAADTTTTASAAADMKLYELQTTFEGGWKQDGVMFDVRATDTTASGGSSGGITILGFDILTPAQNSPICLEIYTKSGSFQGFDSSPDSWTFLGSVSVVGKGKDTPTSIPMGSFDPAYIGMGNSDGGGDSGTRAFYITTQDENLRYTALSADGGVGAEKAGDVTGGVYTMKEHDDAGMTVEIITGLAKNYPFAESWDNRIFNGAIHYRLGNNLDLSSIFSEMSGADVQESVAAKRGYVTCDAVPVDGDAPSAGDVVEEVVVAPTSEPTNAPTPLPTKALTSGPTSPPSVAPTPLPTPSPTTKPTDQPTPKPTTSPTTSPTDVPSSTPTTTQRPTGSPVTILRSVATTLHGGLKQAGMMFDIRIPTIADGGPPEGVTVIAFEVSTFLESEICVEVYTKNGTHVGYESDITENSDGTYYSDHWVAMGAATTTGAGEGVPTLLPLGSVDPLTLSPGETRSFYITMQTPDLRYTEPVKGEKTGDIFSESSLGHMQLMVGSAKSYPFLDTFADRIFNGAVVYHLGGALEENEYGYITADERKYSCSAPVKPSPVVNGTGVDGNEEVIANVTRPEVNVTQPVDAKPSKPPTPAAVNTTRPPAPSPEEKVIAPTPAPQVQGAEARLVAACPANAEIANAQDVVVDYEYELTTDADVDVDQVILEIENVVHGNLVAQKCSGRSGSRTRLLQNASSTISYIGFNSDPVDVSSDSNCASEDTLAEGELCTVVLGGVTATIEEGTDSRAVQEELSRFIEGILADFANLDETGAKQVVVIDPVSSEEGGADENDIDTEFSEAQKEIGGAEEVGGSSGGLNGGAIAGIVFGVVAAVALALALVTLQSKKKNAKMESMRELFDEDMLEEESPGELGKGGNGLYGSTSPLYPQDEEASQQPLPVAILNDQDEVSLVSNDASKFAPVGMFPPPPPESSSLGDEMGVSVEFVRAGQSFGSRSRSYQPEDTVDL